MIVYRRPPASRSRHYQGIQLGSLWYISLDYINHRTSLTADQARADPEGMLRFVISERDPDVANWLECTGHSRGYIQLRWQRLTRSLMPADGPTAEVVPVADLATRLPFYDHARVTKSEYIQRIATRQAAIAQRMLGSGRGRDHGRLPVIFADTRP